MASIKPLAFALSLAAAAPLALAGGGHGGDHHGGGHQGAEANIGQPGTAAEVTRTIEVVLQDNYYDLDSIQVKAGETIRFVLKNEGVLLHEFNIGTAQMHEAHQGEMMKMMEHGMMTPTGMNPEMAGMDHSSMPGMEGMDHDDPNSLLLEPGQSGELIWTFSGDAKLQFACNMPGHYQAGMVGEFKLD